MSRSAPRRILLAAVLLCAPLAARAQSGSHDTRDPYKCSKCRPALQKAVSYVKSNYRKDGLAGHVYAGLMFLVMDDKGAEFQACVRYCTRAVERGGFNRNWYLGMCMYFLSEVYVRMPTAEIHNALVRSFKTAHEQQEKTGGWCHHKEMWKKNNYHKRGGAKDLGMVTSMIYAAFWNLKAAGMTVPKSLFERTEENLEANADKYGITYGTASGWGDLACNRIAYTFLGLSNAGRKDHPFYKKAAKGLPKRFTKMEKCHAFAPLHHYSVAAGMHRLGRYEDFTAEFLDDLLGRCKAGGKISLKCDRGDKYANWTANAACLAIILLLQQDDAFEPPEVSRPVGKDGDSPFRVKKDRKEEKPQVQKTPSSKKSPGKKRNPFGRD